MAASQSEGLEAVALDETSALLTWLCVDPYYSPLPASELVLQYAVGMLSWRNGDGGGMSSSSSSPPVQVALFQLLR